MATPKAAKQKRSATRLCNGCHAPEQIDALGYSNISPYLGYCADCINRAFEASWRKGLNL